LRWRDVDLDAGWLQVGESKTDAGRRTVKIRGVLKIEFDDLRTRLADMSPESYVFQTRSRGKPSGEPSLSRP
jgi:integrase